MKRWRDRHIRLRNSVKMDGLQFSKLTARPRSILLLLNDGYIPILSPSLLCLSFEPPSKIASCRKPAFCFSSSFPFHSSFLTHLVIQTTQKAPQPSINNMTLTSRSKPGIPPQIPRSPNRPRSQLRLPPLKSKFQLPHR